MTDHKARAADLAADLEQHIRDSLAIGRGEVELGEVSAVMDKLRVDDPETGWPPVMRSMTNRELAIVAAMAVTGFATLSAHILREYPSGPVRPGSDVDRSE